ncbi:MAG: hypothetical protein AB7S75_04090 [Desulfococcaceae bacterium]
MMKKIKMFCAVLLPVLLIFPFCIAAAAAADLYVQLTVPACGA